MPGDRAAPNYVLDTNCFIDASHDPAAGAAFEAFCAVAAPRLYLSAVVAAELRAGASDDRRQRALERDVLAPYERRGRILVPSQTAWQVLGTTLAALGRREGLELRRVSRGFALDILLAYSCRERGATLVSRNLTDCRRIARVFSFEFTAPYPTIPAP